MKSNNEYTYICQNSLEGLLSAIYIAYESKDNVLDIVIKHPIQEDFTTEYKVIETQLDNSSRVYDGIIKKISLRAYEYIMMAWLSEIPFRGRHILSYIKLGFQKGYLVDSMMTHPDVLFIHKAYRKVSFERHRFLGICRFSRMEGDFYLCKISPDHNIVALIAPHFSERLGDKKFIIFDEKREISLVCDGEGEWIIVPRPIQSDIAYHKTENHIQDMWRYYFEKIAIKERINYKLQRQFLPQRYWRNLTEFDSNNYLDTQQQ